MDDNCEHRNKALFDSDKDSWYCRHCGKTNVCDKPFRVTIVEQIVESRTYWIDSKTTRDAADIAREIWITSGNEPRNSLDQLTIAVVSREFEVQNAEDKTRRVISESSLIGELEGEDEDEDT